MEYYPEYEHKFIYDNAPSHLKRPKGSVTARNMPKNIPKPGTNWGIEVSKRDVDGNLEYNTDGSIKKHKIQMQDSVANRWDSASLYISLMAMNTLVFLKVWRVNFRRARLCGNARKLRAECKKFQMCSTCVELLLPPTSFQPNQIFKMSTLFLELPVRLMASRLFSCQSFTVSSIS